MSKLGVGCVMKFLFSMSMCLYVIHDPTSFLAFIFIVSK